jgi:small subunit ribosomal protein S1
MGVSDKNAQNNIQPKGNKENLKKPLQVLHISKKDTQKKSQEIHNEKTNSQEEIKNENIAIKPQNINDESLKETENSNENTQSLYSSQQDLNRPFNFSEQNTDFQIERTVDEFDFDESAFLEALNANEPIGATGETITGKWGLRWKFWLSKNKMLMGW